MLAKQQRKGYLALKQAPHTTPPQKSGKIDHMTIKVTFGVQDAYFTKWLHSCHLLEPKACKALPLKLLEEYMTHYPLNFLRNCRVLLKLAFKQIQRKDHHVNKFWSYQALLRIFLLPCLKIKSNNSTLNLRTYLTQSDSQETQDKSQKDFQNHNTTVSKDPKAKATLLIWPKEATKKQMKKKRLNTQT